MSKKTQAGGATPLIPLQVKTREEIRGKMKAIAMENGLSLNDVASMCLAAGIGMVAHKLREIQTPVREGEVKQAA